MMIKAYAHNLLTTLMLFVAMLTMASCSDKKDHDAPKVPAAERTVLVYMVASNNLNYYAHLDIAEMKKGAKKKGALNGGRLVVYLAQKDKSPRLFEINSKGVEVDLMSFPNDEYSVSIARMRQVLAATRAIEPENSLGLILWSHGTGWLEDSNSLNEPSAFGVSLQSFGDDKPSNDAESKNMKLTSLARALDGQDLDFIYFDCCLMGSVEVAYELRHVTRKIVAYGPEIPAEGMPYDNNVPEFFKREANLKAVATNTWKYYMGGVAQPYCALGVVDTSALDELADASRAIMEQGVLPPDDYAPCRYWRQLDNVPCGPCDMGDYYRAFPVDQQLLDRWDDAYRKVVVLELHTPYAYGLDMRRYTGLGTNIGHATYDRTFDYGYRNTQWFNDVVAHNPLFQHYEL